MKLAVSTGLDYRPSLEIPDEMVDPSGRVRPDWSNYLDVLRSFGPNELQRRWKQAHYLLKENGVTFNVYGQDDGMDRPWGLDPFPLILSAEEWSDVESGLKQRVRLLEKLLEDVYGPQIALKEGVLPSPLVYGNPGFLRPCYGLPIPPECRLLMHSVDLVRDRCGRLIALRDRAETPGGCGYALENRLALARMMPESFQGNRIRKLAPFFRALRGTLTELAERANSTPRIVFLTPGAASQTYFEQAYLAQYLGFTLVQGDDLTVRDNRVYLKLLEGLHPVDVIIKRLRDNYCDPLELRSDSVIGIPGLVQAVRAGNVIVANAMGSGWLETPALNAYLPKLCRYYLNEELKLPVVPTFWCGDPESYQYVLENLDSLVLRPTFTSPVSDNVSFPDSSEKERREMRAKLIQEPAAFVAQNQLSLSTTPCLSSKGLEPRCVLLRTFITRDGSGHSVFPGALSLVSSEVGSVVASLETGAGSKDTWVVDSGSSDHGTGSEGLIQRGPIELSRGGGDIPSRAADSLYWLGRYLERAEGMSRILRCCVQKLIEGPRILEQSELPGLLYLINPRWTPPQPTQKIYEIRIVELLTKPYLNDGMRGILDSIHRLTGVCRDRISTESWQISNHLLELSRKQPASMRETQRLLNEMLTGFSAFSGMIAENMTRSHSWRFLEIGRRLERAVSTVNLLRRSLGHQRDNENSMLDALLEVADGVRTYRRRYPAGLQVAPLLDLLLADQANPRSVAYQLHLLERHLRELPGRTLDTPINQAEKLLLRCHSSIKLADVHSLTEVTGVNTRKELTNLLRRLGKDLPELSDQLARQYFSHLLLTSQGPAFGREVLP